MGTLVAVEGLDGAGKNTLVRRLVAEAGGSVATISFPRYGESLPADLAAEALHGAHGDTRDSVYAMALLFAMDRAAAAEQIRAALNSHDLVILDRYVASNAAYSAARLDQGPDGEVVRWVADLEFGRFRLPVPDAQLLLSTPAEVAMGRAARRAVSDDRPTDHYERDGDLQHRVDRAYRSLAEGQWMSPWHLITSEVSPELIRSLLGR